VQALASQTQVLAASSDKDRKNLFQIQHGLYNWTMMASSKAKMLEWISRIDEVAQGSFDGEFNRHGNAISVFGRARSSLFGDTPHSTRGPNGSRMSSSGSMVDRCY
jgi:hypothetical protein